MSGDLYEARSKNGDGFPWVEGPNTSYHSSFDAFRHMEDCEKAAHIANKAYRLGYAQAKQEIRAVLGVKS